MDLLKKDEEISQILKVKATEICNLNKLMAEMKANHSTTEQENLIMIDLKLKYDAQIEKRDEMIHSLLEEVNKVKDEKVGKDMCLQALTETLLSKGKENQKLSEMINEIKNHHLTNLFLNQKYGVVKQGTLINDNLIVSTLPVTLIILVRVCQRLKRRG